MKIDGSQAGTGRQVVMNLFTLRRRLTELPQTAAFYSVYSARAARLPGLGECGSLKFDRTKSNV